MNALIVYASITGNTEGIANHLATELEKLGVQSKVRECTQASPTDFTQYDICVVATYTWGRKGELPDEIYSFYEDLVGVDLTNKVYGALGSGEEAYDYFCKSVDDFDIQFEKTNAIRGSEVVKVELAAQEEDIERIAAFANQLVEKAKEIHK